MIDWREDGSISFDAGGTDIVWEAPTVAALENAYNGHVAALDAVKLISDETGDDEDETAARPKVQAVIEGWVRAVHGDVGTGDLPKNVGDWPHWLVDVRLPGKVRVHWSTHPFGSKISPIQQTETGP